MEGVMKKPIVVFNRKRKEIGTYTIRFQIALIASLLIFILVFKLEFKTEVAESKLTFYDQEEVKIEEVIQTTQEIKAPPPPRPMIPVEVPNDEVIEDEIINLDAEIDFDAVIELPPPPPQADFIVEEEEEEEIFVVVEQPPILLGGIQSVQNRVVYPEMAIKAGIEGRVVVQFVIDKQGNVIDPVVVRGIGGGCDEEAVRAVRTAQFKPGFQRGVPVSVRYTIPITFKLSKDSA